MFKLLQYYFRSSFFISCGDLPSYEENNLLATVGLGPDLQLGCLTWMVGHQRVLRLVCVLAPVFFWSYVDIDLWHNLCTSGQKRRSHYRCEINSPPVPGKHKAVAQCFQHYDASGAYCDGNKLCSDIPILCSCECCRPPLGSSDLYFGHQ